jgi:hypothetical protein
VGSGDGIVESGKDTGRSLFFDEIADDFVVKVVDWCPFDLFSSVLFLFRLESELDENLLFY